MDDTLFQNAYTKLNPAQKKAVDTIEGPVMVIAGPGTGKTQILTLRIANILRTTEMRPQNILALTFTESGVTSMRRRLSEIIGSPAYGVTITTFHSFCNTVIKEYPEAFPHIIGASSITEVDQIQSVEDEIKKLSLKELKPFGDVLFYTRPILNAINTLKREGVTVHDFRKILLRERALFEAKGDTHHAKGPHAGKMKGIYQKMLRDIVKNEELLMVYEAYETTLRNTRHYDYSDMIIEVVRVLETNNDLLLSLQEMYQYILVDEHQDTNNAQNKVLEFLSNFHTSPNIFVVGDEKQAIFRFQGASLENFLYFKKQYPDAVLIVLQENYRSTQHVLDAAESVLSSSTPLHANVSHLTTPIRVMGFSRLEAELYFLATDIASRCARGVEPHEIAVLYRDNADAFPCARALEKVGVPFQIESDEDIFHDHDIQKLITLLRAIHAGGSDETLIAAMHIDFFHIHPLDLYIVINAARVTRTSLAHILHSRTSLNALSLTAPELLFSFFEKFMTWVTMSHNKGLTDFFESLLRESGFLAYVLQHKERATKLEVLNRFFDEIKMVVERHRTYNISEFLEYCAMLETHNILVRKSTTRSGVGSVRLMTAHRAKGLEFETVYIIGASDGHWGNRKKRSPLQLPPRVFFRSDKGLFGGFDENDDERRLFYVALTRAKQNILITYTEESSTHHAQLPSQFIKEIRQELVVYEDKNLKEQEFAHHQEFFFNAPRRVTIDVKDATFVRELFTRNGLSVTALNNYLLCPWKYFYTNLLRIPKAPEIHQMYGIAIHSALKDFFTVAKTRMPDASFLKNAFLRTLATQPLSASDFARIEERGVKVLEGYYETYHGTWRTNVLNECAIRGIFLTPEIRLTGKIDKIEFLSEGHEVNVVDYKTGAPKSRNEIEGKTKNSTGDIKRQLVFYKLLLDAYESGKYIMVSGDIDFVEPTIKGNYVKESFVITHDEIQNLRETILKVSDEILRVAFWNVVCEEKDCSFCALRRMMENTVLPS